MKGSPKTIGSATPLMAAVIELNNQVPPDRLAYYSYFDQHPDWAAESWSGMITEADLQLDGSYLVTLKVVPHLARPNSSTHPFSFYSEQYVENGKSAVYSGFLDADGTAGQDSGYSIE